MARADEAKAAIQCLLRHLDTVVLPACFENRGMIPFAPDNEKAIDDLIRHHLAYQAIDEGQIQLSGAVIDLLNRVTRNHQMHLSGGQVGDLWQEIQDLAEGYHLATRKGEEIQRQEYLQGIQETVVYFSDKLHEATLRFSRHIYHHFAIIADLDLRIRENERCLKEARRLNQLLHTISFTALGELAGSDRQLNRILLNDFRKIIDQAAHSLLDATHRLKDNLGRLQRDREARRLNQLIDVFHQHYQTHLGFEPSLQVLSPCPEAFNRIEPLPWLAYPDVDAALHEKVLSELAAQALQANQRPLRETAVEPVANVEDACDVVIDEPADSVVEAMVTFFDQVLASYTPRSALAAYEELAPPLAADDWLIALVDFHHLHLADGYADIELHFDEIQDSLFNGNHEVHDVHFYARQDVAEGSPANHSAAQAEDSGHPGMAPLA